MRNTHNLHSTCMHDSMGKWLHKLPSYLTLDEQEDVYKLNTHKHTQQSYLSKKSNSQ